MAVATTATTLSTRTSGNAVLRTSLPLCVGRIVSLSENVVSSAQKGMQMSLDPPWKRAQVGRRARHSEEQAENFELSRRVSRSGGGREKGDIRSATWLIEDKFTDAKSYSLTEKDWAKIEAEALQSGRLPMMRITLPGYKLRVMREEDCNYLQAQAAKRV
jgi:hypothetical protein